MEDELSSHCCGTGAPLELAMTACLAAARFELDLHRLALHYLSVFDLNLTRIGYS